MLNALKRFVGNKGSRRRLMQARRKPAFSWMADPLEPRLLLSAAVSSLNKVEFAYDHTRISRILVNGKNILFPGGINLIGSTSGADVPETNYESIGSRDGRMVAQQGGKRGPLFNLQFTPKGTNRLEFVATVGPLNQDFRMLNLAFNFDPKAIRTFEFGGTRLKFRGTGQTDGWHDGSRFQFNDIPQHIVIRDAQGRVRGRVGEAFTRNNPDMQWVKLYGPDVVVTIKLRPTSTNVKEMAIANHFAAHAFGYNVGPMARGESALIKGVIIVEPR